MITLPYEPKSVTKGKLREFFCELFDSHEWFPASKPFRDKDQIQKQWMKCAKCGKRKKVILPAFIYTPFFSSSPHIGKTHMLRRLAKDGT